MTPDPAKPNCLVCSCALTTAQGLILGFCSLKCLPDFIHTMPVGPMFQAMHSRIEGRLKEMREREERAIEKVKLQMEVNLQVAEHAMKKARETIDALTKGVELPGQVNEAMYFLNESLDAKKRQ